MDKIDEKEELREQAGMFEMDGNAIIGTLESEMPKSQVSKEEIDKNPIKFKYEVKLKKLPRKLKSVIGLKTGKIGRVVEVLDSKTVMVDFWDTRPAKIPVKNVYLDIDKTRKEVEIAAGTYKENNPNKDIKLSNEESIKAKKLDQNKPRMELLDPSFLLEVAKGLTYGAKKYSDFNYMEGEGLEYSRIYAAAQRHLLEFYQGIDLDSDSNIDHLAAVAVNCMMLYVLKRKGLGKDDRRFKDES
jgi:hypothetical protein